MKSIDIKAFAVANVVTMVTLVLIMIGSRNLQNFDAALIAYMFGTLFAIFGIVYRYTVWIQRPPTKIYFKSSLTASFSKEGLHFFWFTVKDFFIFFFFQSIIIKHGNKKGIANLVIAIG